MKVRLGFVSNSSSSSYTCQVCGKEGSGMDLGLDDMDMFQCINAHTVCDSHKNEVGEDMSQLIEHAYQYWIKYKKIKKPKDEFVKYLLGTYEYVNAEITKDMIDEFHNEEGEGTRYETAPEYCPICTFKKFIDGDLLKYLICAGINIEATKKEIATKFESYKEFKETIKSK